MSSNEKPTNGNQGYFILSPGLTYISSAGSQLTETEAIKKSLETFKELNDTAYEQGWWDCQEGVKAAPFRNFDENPVRIQ